MEAMVDAAMGAAIRSISGIPGNDLEESDELRTSERHGCDQISMIQGDVVRGIAPPRCPLDTGTP